MLARTIALSIFGLLLAFNLMIWPGALLYVALAEAALFGLSIASSSLATRRRVFECLLTANLAALVAIAPLCLGNDWPQWGAFSAVVLSRFQPFLFATLALQAGLCLLLFDRTFTVGVARRLVAMSVVGTGLLGLSIAFVPELAQSAGKKIDR